MAAPPPADVLRQQEQIQRQEEERQRTLDRQHREMLQRKTQGADVVPEKPAEGAPADTVCFRVDRIEFSGATLLSEADKDELRKPLAGRCLTMGDINELVRALTNLYASRGYVTARAAVPPQDLSTGRLEITVVEGAIEGIRLNEDTAADRLRVAMAFPGLVGKPLNLRDIEQGVDQMNRLSSSSAQIRIEPGGTPGSSIVVVTDKPTKTWRLRPGLDNSGQASSGTHQYSVALDKDNLFGLNDLLTLNRGGDAKPLTTSGRPRSENFSAYYSVPYGYWTMTASASTSEYHTWIKSGGMRYRSTGYTTIYGLEVNRVLHRDAEGKTSLSLSGTTKEIDNYIEGEHLQASSYDLSILGLRLDHSRRLLGGVLGASTEYQLGLPALKAPKDKTSAISSPKHEYYKLNFTASWTRPLDVAGHPVMFSTRATGQWTPDTLYNSERISLGSRQTVRGFQRDSLSGDIGGYARTELSTSPLPEKVKPEWLGKAVGDLQAYLGYDVGALHRDKRDAYERGTLQGAALGLRAQGGLIGMDLCLSHALDAPAFLKKRNWEVYWAFNLNI